MEPRLKDGDVGNPAIRTTLRKTAHAVYRGQQPKLRSHRIRCCARRRRSTLRPFPFRRNYCSMTHDRRANGHRLLCTRSNLHMTWEMID